MNSSVFDLDPFASTLGRESIMRPETGVLAVLSAMIPLGAAGPCAKSKRVAALMTPDGRRPFMAVNSPPAPFICDGSDACRAACGQICVHAEERALAGIQVRDLHTWRPYAWDHERSKTQCIHLKIVGTEPVPSKGPSCVTCSRKLLDEGVSHVWLYLETGWRGYTALEFHEQTLMNLGLPSARKDGRPRVG